MEQEKEFYNLQSVLDTNSYDEFVNKSNIPKEYWVYNVKDYNIYNDGIIEQSKSNAIIKVSDYIANIDQKFKDGKGLYIVGPRNKQCGISLLGTFVLRRALDNLKSCYFIEFSSFLLDITQYNLDLSIYYNVDFLMLDSIDPRRSSKNTKIHDTFSDILSYRRSHNKPIIFSSYMPYQYLADLYCQSINSYVNRYCDLIEIMPSYFLQMCTVDQAILKLQQFSISENANRNKMYTADEIARIIISQ